MFLGALQMSKSVTRGEVIHQIDILVSMGLVKETLHDGERYFELTEKGRKLGETLTENCK